MSENLVWSQFSTSSSKYQQVSKHGQLGQLSSSQSSSTEQWSAQHRTAHLMRQAALWSFTTKGACQDSTSYLASWLKPQKARGCKSSFQTHHHVVSLAVIVMRLMLKCMQTSKVQIQAHTLVWSVSFPAILVLLVMFTFCEHLVISFDSFCFIAWRCPSRAV